MQDSQANTQTQFLRLTPRGTLSFPSVSGAPGVLSICTKSPASSRVTSQRVVLRPFGATTCVPELSGHPTQSLAGRSGQRRRRVVGSGWKLRYGKSLFSTVAASPAPWFSAAAVAGEYREARVASAPASPRPGTRAPGQVLSAFPNLPCCLRFPPGRLVAAVHMGCWR